jgi:hypothetical protein
MSSRRPVEVTQGNDPGISRRALLNGSGASAAMLVLAPRGPAKRSWRMLTQAYV